MAEKKSEFSTVTWQGSAGIEQAFSLKEGLLKAFEGNSKVLLDISQIEDIDITGIQIIVSAEKEAISQNKQFFIAGNVPKQISDFISLTGISLDKYTLPRAEGANA